jgi:anhydro-N-acetylmuramic acid kinase
LFGIDAVLRLSDMLKGYSVSDAIATATRITAESVARAVARFLPRRPDRIIVGGGGLRNAALMRSLAALLGGDITLEPHEAHGIDSDAKEAIAFALLACARVNNIPANIPSVTGARGARLLGVVTNVI